jgi:hypothetical protein
MPPAKKADEAMSLSTTAAARQKEMNVSITEDATIKRMRLGGGAMVVRVDAIVRKAGAAAGKLIS